MHGHVTAKPNLMRISYAALQRPRRIAKKIFRPIAIEGLFSLNQTKLWNGSFQACPGLTLWPLLGRIAAKRIRPHDIEFESLEREISLTPGGFG